jgi:hypothetical protein
MNVLAETTTALAALKKLLTVIFFVATLAEEGSSTITSRSSPEAAVRAVNSDIFFALSAI